MPARSLALILLFLAVVGPAAAQSPPSQAAPAAASSGAAWIKVAEAYEAKIPSTHACLVLVEGTTLFEAYSQPRTAEDLHKINSITKSVISLLVGIAVGEGKIASVDLPLASFFPEAAAGWPERKKRLSIRHLLTMSDGLAWSEDGSYSGPGDSFTNMWASPDPVRYVLERPQDAEPGSRFYYNSGSSHLLSALLQKAVGKTARDYARDKLFAPLGITEFFWTVDRNGVTRGSDGLYLKPRDLAKIGLLCLAGGRWEGKNIVPAGWIERSTAKAMDTPRGLAGRSGYGFQWWMNPSGGYSGRGYGGQYLIVDPKRKTVVVVLGSNFNADFFFPERFMADFVGPAAEAGPPPAAATARLAAAAAKAAAPAPARAPRPLPALAAKIEGRKILLSDGSAASLSFPSSTEARFTLWTGGPPATVPMGMDGNWRRGLLGPVFGPIPPNPVLVRGEWETEDQCRVELALAYDIYTYVFRYRFLPDGRIEESCFVPEIGTEIERLEGRLE